MAVRQSRSLAEQLEPLAVSARRKFSLVRPVSQVVLQLQPDNHEVAFVEARRQVLLWMANRAGRRLPKGAWDGESFDLAEVGAQRTAAVSIEAPRYWAGRLDDACSKVAQRIWTIEIGLGVTRDSKALFGCRLLCVTRGDDLPFEPSIPGVVRQIVENVGSHLDARPVSLQPWLVADEAAVDELVDLLCSQTRRASVFILSLPDGDIDPRRTAISAQALVRSTLGAAHVVILTGPASFHLTDRVGREFSVFNQAARTYRRGLRLESDEPFDHPLALPEKIRSWPNGGSSAFLRLLIAEALRSTVARRDLERELPSFAAVQQLARERRREDAERGGAPEHEVLKLALEELETTKAALVSQKDEYDGLLQIADQERDSAVAELNEATSRISSFRARVRYLEHALSLRGAAPEAEEIPDTLEDLGGWAQEHLTGSVVVVNRALRAAKKSKFENIPSVYQALLLLRDSYVPMRRDGGRSRKQAYEAKLQELGLEDAPCFSATRAGEEGDSYFIQIGGRRKMLDRHLKGGSARDERYVFRLYFLWDDESKQVVVGWLPSHLPTRVS